MDYLLDRWRIKEGIDPCFTFARDGLSPSGGICCPPSNCTMDIREMYVKKISQIWDELENV